MPPPVPVTALDLITDALREIGYLAAHATPTAADATLGLTRLNQILSSWAIQRLTIPGVQRTLYPLTAGTGTYQIGPGVLPPAGFDAYRPQWIQDAGLVRPSGDPLETPLSLLTADRWAAVRSKGQTSDWPWALYDDHAQPVGTLTVYPTPTQGGLQLALYVPVALQRFPSLSQPVVLGEGVEPALMLNLAKALTRAFALPLPQDLLMDAAAAVGWLKRLHVDRLELTIDPAFAGQPLGGYDIYSDTYRTHGES